MSLILHEVAAWGDIDNDGDLDLAFGNYGSAGNSYPSQVYINDGRGILTELPNALGPTSDRASSVAWGDIDNDGDLDLALGKTGYPSGGYNQIYRNNDGVSFDLLWQSTYLEHTSSIAWGDIDGDSDLDLAVGISPGVNRIYENDGDGNFDSFTLPGGENRTTSVAWGDIDGDTDLDLAVGNNGINQVFQNDGHGNLTLLWESRGDEKTTSSIAWGDMDGDGDIDLAVGNYGPGGTYSPGEHNQVYQNDGNGEFSLVWESLGVARTTTSVAWGDVDGDGDLDLAFSNGSWFGDEENQVYRNEGDAVFHLAWSGDDKETNELAWGDMDGDGDLDLAFADEEYASTESNKVYANILWERANLPNSAPVISLRHSGHTGKANFYSSAQILTETTIPITYTLFDQERDPLGQVDVFYSTDGGGHWLPAVPAEDTVTTNLTTSPYPTTTLTNTHVFEWDTFASGFFGQSDNVVLRFVAQPQARVGMTGTFLYPNSTVGPLQRPAASATTFPFRVRGTQVRVLSGTVPVANAQVYRLPAGQTTDAQLITNSNGTPFHTNEQGYLQGYGQLEPGDRLVAMMPVASTDNYTVYHTSAAPTTTGLDMFTVTEPGVQELVVSPHNPFILFNMLVSLEWDARQDTTFLNQLELDIQRASEILYDMTNGQAALNLVHIYHNKGYWGHANLIIHANNSQRPSAILGGSVLTPTDDIDINDQDILNAYVPGQVRMGPTWNRFGNPDGTLGEDWPRALAHELGHYYFFHPDNYLGLSSEGFLKIIDCPGSVMDDPYIDSEFLTADEWTGGCLDSLAEKYLGRSDWETVEQFYPMLNSSDALAGPTTLPLAVTQIETFAPVTPTTVLAAPFFRLVDEVGNPISIPQGRAQAYLYKTQENDDPVDDFVIAQGTPIGDIVQARGAAPGDRLCVFDFSQFPIRLGCLDSVGSVATPITLHEVTDWEPQIIVSPINTTTVVVTATHVSASNLQAQLLPALGQASEEVVMTAVSADTFSQTLTAPDGAYYGYVRVWVPDSNPLQEMILPFVAVEDWGGQGYAWGGQGYAWGGQGYAWGGQGYAWGGQGYAWGGQGYAWGAPSMSNDGQVSVFPLENLFGSSRDFTLQQVPLPPALPAWLAPVGQAYRFEAAGTISESALLFRYLARDVPSGQEPGLRIYYLPDGDSVWQRLDTELDTYNNHASAQVQGEGIYMLVATIEVAPSFVEGWNTFGYPVQQTRSVTEALASISGNYSAVVSFDPIAASPWKTYYPEVNADFVDQVNTLSELEYTRAYWVYATKATTLYLGPDSGWAQHAKAEISNIQMPPATYYGWIIPEEDFVPTVGTTVTAWIDGKLCGETAVQEIAGQLAYVLQVKSGDGCGKLGQMVTIKVGDQSTGNAQVWDNSEALFYPLPEGFFKIYLPMVIRP